MALTIAKHRVDDNLVITLEGRLDSTNSQELMDAINNRTGAVGVHHHRHGQRHQPG